MNVARAAALATAIALWLLGVATGADDLATSISPSELHAQQQKGTAPLIIDVRTAEEYSAGHVPDAVNIPHTDLAKRLGEVKSQNGVALYCMIGPRARLGEETLREAGVTKIYHLEGGFAAWRESGLPVEEGGE